MAKNNEAPKGEAKDEPAVDAPQGDNEGTESVESLKAALEEARAEAAANRGKLKTVIAERDTLKQTVKKAPPTDEEGNDYKTLYAQEQGARGKLLEKVKNSDIRSAATARLTKAGVLPEALELAIQSLDKSLIEWDEDNGVDETSLTAAVQKLKGNFGFIFEKKVSSTKPVIPVDGSTSNGDEKVMSRAEYRKLQQTNPALVMKRFKEGWKLGDQ